MSAVYAPTLGVDAGSRQVKLAVSDGSDIVFTAKLDTIKFYIELKNGGANLDVKRLNALSNAPDFERLVSTGYGRNNVKMEGGFVIPEIHAHVSGALFQTGLADFTLVDLGGQDTKVVNVKNGMVDDFVMNDKCAAGSGRYLENIAHALDVSLTRLGKCHENPAPLSNTCATFGESEVIELVSEGVAVDSILAGANRSVVSRLLPMVVRYKPKVIVATGGVAKNEAIRKMLSDETGVEVIVPNDPQLNGAIGCCLS
jgi:predicted CoA-substrate-specific enzyme activase